ncbi:hypothetical protein AU192_01285 [Mycobacterium lehmannii]|uniref:Uncharacterized protein n=1 Tax=Mycobacterium lehmannii TaxID=2048550 RepID=A0A117JI66_9MYCO|nr:hypothetical protein [Mycobacterium lehmannii]KUI11445.1 hypothetical protein AU192_01285 [Mycobacterium lehmannii]
MTHTMTDAELDAAILDALRATPDGCGWWADIRSQLPDERFWPPITSLVRLIERGQVDTVKISGRDYVCLAIELPPRRPRRRGPA